MLVKNPCVRKWNQPVTNDRRYSSHLVGTSETTRATYFGSNETLFNQWLAGLIDDDGSLQVSKAGYSSCEITVALADERIQRIIQNKLGGSIKPRSGVQPIRWRLHNRSGMLEWINRVNGYIRHSSGLVQLNRVCALLSVQLLSPYTLHNNHCWFSGFFDADGTISYSFKGSNHPLTLTNYMLIECILWLILVELFILIKHKMATTNEVLNNRVIYQLSFTTLEFVRLNLLNIIVYFWLTSIIVLWQ